MHRERTKDKALLAKYSNVMLDDSQHDDICKITATLEDRHGDQLEEIYKEAGSFVVVDSIREIWRKDRQ